MVNPACILRSVNEMVYNTRWTASGPRRKELWDLINVH